MPGASQETDVTWLRVLLVADLLARAAETRELQALTAVMFVGEASGPVRGRIRVEFRFQTTSGGKAAH